MPKIKGTHVHPSTKKLLTYQMEYQETAPGQANWSASVWRKKGPLHIKGGIVMFSQPATAVSACNEAAQAEIDALSAEDLAE